MTTVHLACPITGCGFVTVEVATIEAAVELLKLHGLEHQQTRQNAQHVAPPTPRAPKFERPKIKSNSSPEEWNAFMRRWSTFQTGYNITDADAPGQLLECTSQKLGDIVLRAHPNYTSKPIAEAITILRSLAVVPVALGVLRSELDSMVQDPDEPFRTFAARVQGKAETCEFTTAYSGKCPNVDCQRDYTGITYYTDERMRDVLLNGIADVDIRREALSCNDILQRSINDVIAFVEAREVARNANPTMGVSSVSQYRRQLKQPPAQSRPDPPARSLSPTTADKAKTEPCPDCGVTFNLFTKKSRGWWNKKPHTRCQACWKKRNDQGQHNAIQQELGSDNPFGQISAVSSVPDEPHNSVL